ncbi:MAG: integrase core domain-containing protein [Ilumatobacteraceae bacterium]
MSDGDQRNGRGGSTRGVDGWQSRLGTLGVVTAVTVLIWTWAAGKTESSEILDGVELRFTTTEPSRLRITPPTIRLSQLTARGSTRALNRLRELPRTFEFTAGSGGVPATEGTHVLSVSDLFSRISEVADSGLAIDAEPATVEIVVTALESRTLRLEALSGPLAADAAELQARLDAWRATYNQRRPHGHWLSSRGRQSHHRNRRRTSRRTASVRAAGWCSCRSPGTPARAARCARQWAASSCRPTARSPRRPARTASRATCR